MDWIGWHLPELIGTTAPLVGAWLVSAWCALVSIAVATWWAVHEARARPERTPLRTTLPAPTAELGAHRADGTSTREQAGEETGS